MQNTHIDIMEKEQLDKERKLKNGGRADPAPRSQIRTMQPSGEFLYTYASRPKPQ